MKPQSDNSAGSSDVARLLDLLNTTERLGEKAERIPAMPAARGAVSQPADGPEAILISAKPPVTPDPVDLSTDQQEAVENRYAAHIVSGMSKLKRT
jgi:hypothetical protein